MKRRLFIVHHVSGKRAIMVSTEGMTLEEARAYALSQFRPECVKEVAYG